MQDDSVLTLLIATYEVPAVLSVFPMSIHALSRRLVLKKTVFSAWASTLNVGLINKVDMVCLSPVGYGV